MQVNSFDRWILVFVNGFAHRSSAFDNFVVYVGNNPLLTGGVLMALLWWAWAESKQDRRRDRETLIFGLLGSILVGLLTRAVAVSVPFRLRPLHNPALHFQLPYGMDPTTLMGWSSFPSDHAAVYFCLATTIWMVSRRLGIIAVADATLVICLPRLYEGIHYPTDLLVGAVLGIGMAYLSQVEHLRTAVTRPTWPWLERHPGSFYATLFLFTAEVGTGFALVHDLARGALNLLEATGFALR
jgi:undecaprenyl-diphosphatase